ncbi:MAG: hypothetical protein ACLUD0_09865 [Eubacterium ramulus]
MYFRRLKNPGCDYLTSGQGMKDFRELVYDSVAQSEEYLNLKREMEATGKNFGYLKSVTIGINLDENLRPKEAGIISVNEKNFLREALLDKLMKHRLTDRQVMMTPLYPLQKGLHGEEQKAIELCDGKCATDDL